MKLNVQGPDELIAALPHILGFTPVESLILVPFTPALPVARVDLPGDSHEREAMVDQLRPAYLRHAGKAGPEAVLAVVCITENRHAATAAAVAIEQALSPQLRVPIKLWANERAWTDLDTGRTGPRSTSAAGRFAAETVAAGRAMPARSREDLHTALVGDRAGIAASLPAALDGWEASTVDTERRWVTNRVDRFLGDGVALSDPDAARLLVATQASAVRDAAWALMNRDDHQAHRALWSDLTRRAPDEVRAPAATLLAFSAWLGGDGAGAWTALDQIPEGQRDYRMATLVATAIQSALPPSDWEQIRPALFAESTADLGPPIDPSTPTPRRSGPVPSAQREPTTPTTTDIRPPSR